MLTPEPIYGGDMKTVLVVGSWSSGTTAVTGYLSRLGGFTCPPTIQTNDPRTPDSEEPVAFRNALAHVFDEERLVQIRDISEFRKWFTPWLNYQKARAFLNGKSFVVLKHPLSALAMDEIERACRPVIVMVTRPFEEIEKTRMRRGWLPHYGAAGAEIVYQSARGALERQDKEFIELSFSEFLSDPALRADLRHHCDLTSTERAIAAAEAWLR